MVEIRWLKEAVNDLQNIFEYISRDSKRYAKLNVEKIVDRTQILKKHIHAGKIVDEINKPEIREIIQGRYRIIYRIVDEQNVDILMVHHSSRDLPGRLEE